MNGACSAMLARGQDRRAAEKQAMASMHKHKAQPPRGTPAAVHAHAIPTQPQRTCAAGSLYAIERQLGADKEDGQTDQGVQQAIPAAQRSSSRVNAQQGSGTQVIPGRCACSPMATVAARCSFFRMQSRMLLQCRGSSRSCRQGPKAQRRAGGTPGRCRYGGCASADGSDLCAV